MTLFSEKEWSYLLSLAKSCIEHGLAHEAPILISPKTVPAVFNEDAETAVSIKLGSRNLGCILNYGKPIALYESVIRNAFAAGFEDSRFAPINRNVLKEATLSVHYLSKERENHHSLSLNQILKLIKPEDTLVVRYLEKSAVMLASMQSFYGSVEAFCSATREKAEIPSSVDWTSISISLVKTSAIEDTLYSKIPCLNTD